jgi:hypothetical protein
LASVLITLETGDFQDLIEGERQFGLPIKDEGDLPQGTIKHETTQRNLGDLVNEVINNEINLSPEFQREYVWPRVRALRYIESLLLDIPTPSILLYEVGRGRLGVGNYNDVVDGRQRLETLLRFVATREQLQNLGYEGDKRIKTPKEDHKDFKSFQREGPLHEYANKFFSNLDPGMQRRFTYRKIPATVITADDRKMLYHVFERYNLGSQKLNAAEIRNAVYQKDPIHKTVWELAREGQPDSEEDPDIGRVMAFTYLKVEEGDAKPSANVGTNRFFDDFDDIHGDHAKIRGDFVKAFYKVGEWYEQDYAFVQPPRTDSRSSRGQFHAWAARLQMATAHYLRLQIEERLLDEHKVKAYIQSNWCAFAGIDPIDRLS